MSRRGKPRRGARLVRARRSAAPLAAPGAESAAGLVTHPPDLDLCCALGGTRTPNLLIRRWSNAVHASPGGSLRACSAGVWCPPVSRSGQADPAALAPNLAPGDSAREWPVGGRAGFVPGERAPGPRPRHPSGGPSAWASSAVRAVSLCPTSRRHGMPSDTAVSLISGTRWRASRAGDESVELAEVGGVPVDIGETRAAIVPAATALVRGIRGISPLRPPPWKVPGRGRGGPEGPKRSLHASRDLRASQHGCVGRSVCGSSHIS